MLNRERESENCVHKFVSKIIYVIDLLLSALILMVLIDRIVMPHDKLIQILLICYLIYFIRLCWIFKKRIDINDVIKNRNVFDLAAFACYGALIMLMVIEKNNNPLIVSLTIYRGVFWMYTIVSGLFIIRKN